MTRPCVRRAVALALAVLLVAVGATAIADNDRGREYPQLAGTWWARVDFQGVQLLTYVAQFWADGRASIILASGLPVNPTPDSWADSRSACPGEWRRTGHHRFDVTLYCLWSNQDYGMVPDRIRLKLTLDKKGKSFTAPFKYEYWVVDHYEGGYGVEYGKRLDIVPYE